MSENGVKNMSTHHLKSDVVIDYLLLVIHTHIQMGARDSLRGGADWVARANKCQETHSERYSA